jgi:CDP-diacylglycerol--glycerol-3-phosphate 3-phosphatidyltransferase
VSLALLRRSFFTPGWVFLLILAAGILSDIFDGVIARRVGVVSARLRRQDSQTDLIFWLGASAAAVLLHPDVVRRHGLELSILVGLEICCYGVSFIRFGKETCTHAYSAKVYGIGLFVGMASVLGFGSGGWPLHAMFVAGLIAGIDVIAIVLLLPGWTYDVPSSYHALQIRRALRSVAAMKEP